MICPVLDKQYERLDAAKAAHPDEVMSAEEIHWIWEIQAHANRGHNGKPCPGDWARGLTSGEAVARMDQIRRPYRGYIIQSTSFLLRGGAGYTPHLVLTKHTASWSEDTHVHTGKVFASDEAALEGGIAMGEEMIDAGVVPSSRIILL